MKTAASLLLLFVVTLSAFAQDPPARTEDAYHIVSSGREKLNGKDYRGAIEDLTRSISIDSTIAGAYNYRALARIELGDLQGALDDFNRSLVIEPREVWMYYQIAKVYHELQDPEGEIGAYSKILTLGPGFEKAWIMRGLVQTHLGNHTDAVADFTTGFERSFQGTGSYWPPLTLEQVVAIHRSYKTVAADTPAEAERPSTIIGQWNREDPYERARDRAEQEAALYEPSEAAEESTQEPVEPVEDIRDAPVSEGSRSAKYIRFDEEGTLTSTLEGIPDGRYEIVYDNDETIIFLVSPAGEASNKASAYYIIRTGEGALVDGRAEELQAKERNRMLLGLREFDNYVREGSPDISYYEDQVIRNDEAEAQAIKTSELTTQIISGLFILGLIIAIAANGSIRTDRKVLLIMLVGFYATSVAVGMSGTGGMFDFTFVALFMLWGGFLTALIVFLFFTRKIEKTALDWALIFLGTPVGPFLIEIMK